MTPILEKKYLCKLLQEVSIRVWIGSIGYSQRNHRRLFLKRIHRVWESHRELGSNKAVTTSRTEESRGRAVLKI